MHFIEVYYEQHDTETVLQYGDGIWYGDSVRNSSGENSGVFSLI